MNFWNEPEDDDDDMFCEVESFAVKFPKESNVVPSLIVSDGTSDVILTEEAYTPKDIMDFIEVSPMLIHNVEGVRILVNQKRIMSMVEALGLGDE